MQCKIQSVCTQELTNITPTKGGLSLGKHQRKRDLDELSQSQCETAMGKADQKHKMHEESTFRHKEAVVSLYGETSPLGLCTTSAIKFKRTDLTGAAGENGCTGVTYKVGQYCKTILEEQFI